MKITIIYDNTSFRKDLQADWGFSALVEEKGRKILFDTGADGAILLSNMRKLDINPADIKEIFISHPHFDHIGGLTAFLRQNNKVKIWVPSYFEELENVKDVIIIPEPLMLYEGIYSTGELDEIEQSLCVETEKGIVIIVGCSHPEMEHILKAASSFGKPYAIIGGLHGTRPESLKDLDIICTSHCTQHKKEIKHLYPDKCIDGGAGRIIEI